MDRKAFARQLRRQMTDAERLLWHHLRSRRLGGHKFRRQHPLGPYVVDFVQLEARLVVEADGGQHQCRAADLARNAWLQRHGFRVLRFWNNEILGETEAVLAVIAEAAESPHPVPLPKGEGTE